MARKGSNNSAGDRALEQSKTKAGDKSQDGASVKDSRAEDGKSVDGKEAVLKLIMEARKEFGESNWDLITGLLVASIKDGQVDWDWCAENMGADMTEERGGAFKKLQYKMKQSLKEKGLERPQDTATRPSAFIKTVKKPYSKLRLKMDQPGAGKKQTRRNPPKSKATAKTTARGTSKAASSKASQRSHSPASDDGSINVAEPNKAPADKAKPKKDQAPAGSNKAPANKALEKKAAAVASIKKTIAGKGKPGGTEEAELSITKAADGAAVAYRPAKSTMPDDGIARGRTRARTQNQPPKHKLDSDDATIAANDESHTPVTKKNRRAPQKELA